MSDNSIIQISDEQAKLISAGGSYLADILGDLPKDLVGILGDQVKVYRAKRLAALWDKAKYYLSENGCTTPELPGLNLVIPILEAAADENREELQDLWARLLAATMQPDRLKLVRRRFIEALKKLDPLDAKVMLYLRDDENKIPFSASQGTIFAQTNAIASALTVNTDEVKVSIENIIKSGFAFNTSTNKAVLTPFGCEFMRTIC